MGRTLLLYTLLVAAAVIGKALRLDRPWTLGYDQMGARYSVIARNYVEDGLLDPPLIQKLHTGDPPPALTPPPYRTHPPLVPLLVAGMFAVTGTFEAWAARLAMLPASLLALLLVHRIARRVEGPRYAAAALLVMVVMPASSFYGTLVDPVGWWIVALGLAFVLAMDPWLERSARGPGLLRGLLVSALFLIGMLAEWHMVFWVPIVLAAWWARGRPRKIVPLVPLLIAVVLAGLIYRAVVPPEGDGGYGFVVQKLATVSAWGPELGSAFLAHLRELFGLPLITAAGLGLAFALVRAARGRSTSGDRVVWTLLTFQALLTLVYPTGVRMHDYYLLTLAAPVALLAGSLIVQVHDRLRERAGRRWAGSITGLILLVGSGVSVQHTIRRWRAMDDYAAPVLRDARAIHETVRPDEVAGMATEPNRLESLRFHANRMVIQVSHPEILRGLERGSLKPAAVVVSRDRRADFPALVAHLEARGHRTESAYHTVYDLRDRSPPPTERAPDRPTAVREIPGNIRTRVEGARVRIAWDPVTAGDVAGYTLYLGDRPGFYPLEMNVERPCVDHALHARATVHFAVAARFKGDRVGPLSPDHAFSVDAPASWTGPTLAVLAALLSVSLLYGLLLRRGGHRTRL